ncbi:MAG: DUF6364 family protein [Flavobacteriales bacterium]
MKAKLTLLLDKGTIEEAKKYAAENDTSLSRMFEQFLRSLQPTKFIKRGKEAPKRKLSPEVERLSGIIKLPDDFDIKKGYGDYLAKKYGV